MQEIIIADLALPTHAAAVVYLLNEYAKDNMGGSAELSAFVKDNLIAELRKRQVVHIVLAIVDAAPAGLAIYFEGFSSFACKPLLNIHDIIVAKEYRGRGFQNINPTKLICRRLTRQMNLSITG